MKILKKLKKGGINLYKLSLFTTSYIPIFLMIFINNMNDVSIKEVQNTFMKNWIFWVVILVVFIMSLLVLCDFLKELKNTENQNIKPVELSDKKLENHESEIINYFVTFLIPILTLNPLQWNSILSNVLFIALVGIYFVKNNLLSFNILLIILNFSIYKDQYSNIYITKANTNEIIIKKLGAYQYKQSNIFYIPKNKAEYKK